MYEIKYNKTEHNMAQYKINLSNLFIGIFNKRFDTYCMMYNEQLFMEATTERGAKEECYKNSSCQMFTFDSYDDRFIYCSANTLLDEIDFKLGDILFQKGSYRKL